MVSRPNHPTCDTKCATKRRGQCPAVYLTADEDDMQKEPKKC